MAELIWEGKHDKKGNKVAPFRPHRVSLVIFAMLLVSGCGVLDSKPDPEPEPVIRHIRYTVIATNPQSASMLCVAYEVEGQRKTACPAEGSSWQTSFEARSPGIAFVEAWWMPGIIGGMFRATGTVTVRIYVDGIKQVEQTGEKGTTSEAEASCRY